MVSLSKILNNNSSNNDVSQTERSSNPTTPTVTTTVPINFKSIKQSAAQVSGCVSGEASSTVTTTTTATTTSGLNSVQLTVEELFDDLKLICDESIRQLDRIERQRKQTESAQKKILDELKWRDSSNNNNSNTIAATINLLQTNRKQKHPQKSRRQVRQSNKRRTSDRVRDGRRRVRLVRFWLRPIKNSRFSFRIVNNNNNKNNKKTRRRSRGRGTLEFELVVDEFRLYFSNFDSFSLLDKHVYARFRLMSRLNR